MEISEKLRTARIHAGLNQEEAAEAAMVSRVTVSHWENGKSLPDIVSLIRLSDLYHMSLDDMLKGDIRMEKKIAKDSRDLRVVKAFAQRLGIIIGIFALFLILSRFIGGGFEEFVWGAAPWVAAALAVSCFAVCLDTSDTDQKKPQA